MNEEEWLTSNDPQAMVRFVLEATTNWRTRWVGWMQTQRFRYSERKWRLLDLACCQRIARLVPAEVRDELFYLARRFAEGSLSDRELSRGTTEIASTVASRCFPRWGPVRTLAMPHVLALEALGRLLSGTRTEDDALANVLRARRAEVEAETGPGGRVQVALAAERSAQADLIRDVLGNPFQPATLDLAWLTSGEGIVVRLARSFDQEPDGQLMPILADALEEAGCTDQGILGHCRHAPVHVPGCWVVDLLLGKP